MRCWQYIGFNPAAELILNQQVVIGKRIVVNLYDDGRKDVSTADITRLDHTKEVYERHDPWYDGGVDLEVLTFDDGRKLETFVQAEPWSSGPCTFMALRDHLTKVPLAETLWSQEDINKA